MSCQKNMSKQGFLKEDKCLKNNGESVRRRWGIFDDGYLFSLSQNWHWGISQKIYMSNF